MARMQEIYDKEVRKAKGKSSELVQDHKEVLELCQLHVVEIEKMEKARGAEGYTSDRDLLLAGGGTAGVCLYTLIISGRI